MSTDPTPGTARPGHHTSRVLANLVPLAYLVAVAIAPDGALDPVRALVVLVFWWLVAHAVRLCVELWPARRTGTWAAADPADSLPTALTYLPFP